MSSKYRIHIPKSNTHEKLAFQFKIDSNFERALGERSRGLRKRGVTGIAEYLGQRRARQDASIYCELTAVLKRS